MANLEDHPLVNLSRSSNQTYFDSNGVLQTAPANSLPPSYEYNSATGLWEKKGWYIGEARENLIQYSEAFNNAVWDEIVSFTISITSNTIIAPDNSTTADKIIELSSGNTAYGLEQKISLTSGNNYTLSVFSKAAERDFIRLFHGNASLATVWFNISTGSIGTTQGSDFISAEIKKLKDGWYRCSMTFTASSNSQGFLTSSSDGVTTTTGDGSSGIYIWGAQLEEGSFPSPYIPTNGSTVTRSATLADITDLSWYNQNEGTFVVEFTTPEDNPNGNQKVIYLSSADDDRISIRTQDSGYRVIYRESDGGLVPFDTVLGSFTPNSDNKIATSFKDNNFAACLNGGTVSTDNTGDIPIGFEKLSLGGFEGNFFLNSYIKSLKYYPKRLSNSQLQSLTS